MTQIHDFFTGAHRLKLQSYKVHSSLDMQKMLILQKANAAA